MLERNDPLPSLCSRGNSRKRNENKILVATRITETKHAVRSGIQALDLPCGGVTEIYGPPSSGRTTLLLLAPAQATPSEEVCARLHLRFEPGAILNLSLRSHATGHEVNLRAAIGVH
jgi:RecA/RadA recombinase